jgi:hypothetical protein
MNFFMTQWGLKEKEFTSKLVSFGVDGLAPSKALNLELQFKSNVDTSILALMYIIWLIKQT